MKQLAAQGIVLRPHQAMRLRDSEFRLAIAFAASEVRIEMLPEGCARAGRNVNGQVAG